MALGAGMPPPPPLPPCKHQTFRISEASVKIIPLLVSENWIIMVSCYGLFDLAYLELFQLLKVLYSRQRVNGGDRQYHSLKPWSCSAIEDNVKEAIVLDNKSYEVPKCSTPE
uniref:Uncharacterized protein n=1 Tax=Oryza meridionalis TaxID=40149 RepID=A0A0E0F873_9ORYZ